MNSEGAYTLFCEILRCTDIACVCTAFSTKWGVT